MADFLLNQENMEVDFLLNEKKRKDMENMEKAKRHYKKDSRYLEDLYTFTYQDEFSMEEDILDDEHLAFHNPRLNLELQSLQVTSHGRNSRASLTRSLSGGNGGPWSLAINEQENKETKPKPQSQCLQFASDTLDTNLHKILARRMAGGEKVSFQACKLLTKAYYSLLRGTDAESKNSTLPCAGQTKKSAKDDPKLGWQTLLDTDTQQLLKIVAGYSALVNSLNDELVEELEKKDSLRAEQDTMLDHISELSHTLV